MASVLGGLAGRVRQNDLTRLLRSPSLWAGSFTLQEFGYLFFLLGKDGIGLRLSWCLGRFLRWFGNCECEFFSLKNEKVDRDGNGYLLPLFGVVRGVVVQGFSFS